MSKTEQQQLPTIEQTSPSTNTEENDEEGLEEDEECESGGITRR